MKKRILAAAIMMATTSAFAQREAGSITVQPRIGVSAADFNNTGDTEARVGEPEKRREGLRPRRARGPFVRVQALCARCPLYIRPDEGLRRFRHQESYVPADSGLQD